VLAVLGFGILFLRLHSLPERMAHKTKKIQFEIVAVLCLIALFTHIHIFWVAALLLAMIDLPDFGTSLSRIAGSAEKIAGLGPGEGAVDLPYRLTPESDQAGESQVGESTDVAAQASGGSKPGDGATTSVTALSPRKEPRHA
jgi:hypothetical protein